MKKKKDFSVTPNPKFVFHAGLRFKIIFLTKPGNPHKKEV